MNVIEYYPALTLMILWLLVWGTFFAFGKRGGSGLPLDSHLMLFSTSVLLLIFFYYIVAFNAIGSFSESQHLMVVDKFFHTTPMKFVALLLSITGAAVMIVSRLHLHSLSVPEILFSKNTIHTKKGLYKRIPHPMYGGISLILIGSFIMYPTVPGIFILLAIGFLIKKKIQLEV